MRYLRESTATTVMLGPFLDETNGYTPETGLTVTSIDVDLYKHDDDMTVASPRDNVDLTITALDGGTNDMAHIANGYYALELTATDTNTLGRLLITANISGAIPVWHEFMVVPADVYDGLFGTISEKTSGAPPATPNFGEILMYFWMYFRNQKTSTSSELSMSDDAGDPIAESDQTDSGGTYTSTQWGAPD